ncbi:hypothetical protein Q5P01_015946 [Channa striata]|uniref:Uncharacterized protein n=1 Tax=Channa striata TaxID=64152 RepID=A0AA88MFR4_CHASR|nr:hypothetical protein Q5P01_015946 [Channa striata]
MEVAVSSSTGAVPKGTTVADGIELATRCKTTRTLSVAAFPDPRPPASPGPNLKRGGRALLPSLHFPPVPCSCRRLRLPARTAAEAQRSGWKLGGDVQPRVVHSLGAAARFATSALSAAARTSAQAHL